MDLQRIKATAAARKTVFTNASGAVHDRSQFLGGSEAYGCIRRSWFSKHDTPKNDGYTESWGHFARGHAIEDWAVDLIRKSYPQAQYHYTGADQTTLVHQNLAVTPDGLLVLDGEAIVVEIKSLDPRSNLDRPKPQHVFQAQLQIEMFHQCTEHRPEKAFLFYVNASDFSDLRLHPVERDEGVITAALNRASQVFNTADPLLLAPEGNLSDECKYCAWTQACGDALINHFPTDKLDALPADLEEDLAELIERRENIKAEIGECKQDQAVIDEQIKVLLRQHNIKAAKAEAFNISYALVSGRKSLDLEAVEAEGIDLTPFYKEGKPSERLTVKLTKTY
ncbi:MAG: hypothetical protein H7842_02470 [Gammaproteobacteria bacterium SHHR-1]